MKTTLNQIREHSPCADGWGKLLKHLGKTKANDEELTILTILGSNGLDDALWCLRAVEGHDIEKRRFAIFCAQQVEHLMIDDRSRNAIAVAERYCDGQATDYELQAAANDANDAEANAAAAAPNAAAYAATTYAAAAAAYAAAAYAAAAAYDAAAYATDTQAAQEAELRSICELTK